MSLSQFIAGRGNAQRRRATFALVGIASAALFVGLTYGFVAQPALLERYALFAAGWWLSAIAAIVSAVAACHTDDDPSDDPHYLGSLVAGLRDEWRRT